MIDPTDGLDLDDIGMQAVARELEAFADDTRVAPSPDLIDRIMAAIADQPVPTPPVAFLHAVGALALADAWRAWWLNLRVALGGGPASGRLRSQALAVVIVSALIVSIGGATVAVGAARLVQAMVTPTLTVPDATPTPSPDATPGPEATPSPPPDASPSPAPTTSADASDEPEESESPDASSGSGESHGGSSGPGGGRTADPDETVDPDETEEPDDTDDSGSGSGSGSGRGGSSPGDDD
jgi:hypothetical protein